MKFSPAFLGLRHLVRIFPSLVLGVSLMACQANPPTLPERIADAGNRAGAMGIGNGLAVDQAGRARPYYVRVQPEATSLQAVADDGDITYLEFGILPSGEFKFSDAEGKPLAAVWLRNLAAIQGTHQGILIRLGSATSYISLHPHADQMRKPAFVENAAVLELRDRLVMEVPRAAMNRALLRAEQVRQEPTHPEARTAPSVSIQSPAAELVAAENQLAREDMLRSVERSKMLPAASTVISIANGSASATAAADATARPNALPANAAAESVTRTTEAGWPRTQRVFFATNSVSIASPDDGLHRILQDARQSDEVWIAGHTDSTGPRAVNVALAKRRAEAIRYVLTSRGIAPDRIMIVRAPVDTYIADNETEMGRAQNRRVEVTFVRTRPLPPKTAYSTATGN